MSWPDEYDALVRGLAHALSNRAVSLGMAGDALDDDEGPVREASRAQVRADVERLSEITRLLKLLPREGMGRPQALQVSEVLADALALHAHHLELRDVPITTSVSTTAVPVRIERWALLRALLLLVSAARREARGRAAGEGAAAVALFVEGSEEQTAVRAEGTTALDEELSAAARDCGGRAEVAPDGVRLVLPSLVALRRHEGRGA